MGVFISPALIKLQKSKTNIESVLQADLALIK